MENKLKRGVDYIGVGVGAVIVNGLSEIFFSQRGPKARNERGAWEFPGGAVEFGERLADALKREIFEEFGIVIEVGPLLDVFDHILPDEGQHWVSPTFICRLISGEPSIHEPEKCSAIGWFSPDQAPLPISMISKENLLHYREYLRKQASA